MNAAPTPTLPGPVYLRKAWHLRHNPFPQAGIARLGGDDARENGTLFRPEVMQESVNEARDKFLLGAAYSGLKFGYLWSLGTGRRGGDARGYGKSSLLQYIVERTNVDFGGSFLTDAGLDGEDADEMAICAVLTSFDMATARSLHAVFYEAAKYGCRFRVGDNPTLAARLRTRLIERLGTDSDGALLQAAMEAHDDIKGRTIGPPDEDFLRVLCQGDEKALARHIEGVKSGARARIGAANYLATLLTFARAAGVGRVLLGCDQLEDFAATTTAKQKRSIETERFRDYVLELQPMADMLSVVVTLHPRAARVIDEMWRLADLPSFEHADPQNARHVVLLHEIASLPRAKKLLVPYLDDARRNGAQPGDLAPLTESAVDAILQRSDGKPRDILRRAHALIEHGAEENWDEITAERAASVLDSIAPHIDEEEETVTAPQPSVELDW